MMLWRALILALVSVSALALTPLSAAADDNDCALYLAGPGRTSAYDYRLNLLRGNFGYDGQHTCITYDAVNQAYLEARKRILVAQPKGDWTPEDYASVGELVLDISINLARTYGLTYEEIEKGLPLIDTSRTLIREVCPPVFSHVECRAGKYRRLDGLCNNLRQPTWGATMAPFQRLIGPLFSDGINAPRIGHSGRDLPLSRVVSRTMHPDDGFHDHAGTVMVIAWGQFMDHDYTLTGTPLDPRNRNDPEECCKRPAHLKHPYCNEIRIPDDDYFYRLFGVKCIDFVRGFPSPRPGCRLGSRVPFNTLTGAIDGNTVYGVTEKFARKLRTGYGGLLRMNPVFEEYGLKDLLPLKLDIPDEGCTRPNKNMYCFEAGEIRVNEQLVLTVMHTLMAREHNRVAKGLAAVNPHWDDETLYQEARRINIAEIQHITYNEFLPVLLGKDVMEKFGLVLEKEGYWDGYDQNVNPDVIDAFAAAAYRFGHSLLPTAVERWSKAHKFIASKRLSDLIRRPYDIYRAGVLDEYVMGLMNQVAQAMDDSITQEVTNHLFKKVGARFGMDLVSFNMQRGREFGLPGYMEFRKFCGLSGADSFQELLGSMSNDTVRKYESIFEHPIDVDLWSGGVSERPLPGSMLGPTFACIIATQFSYSRRGDRFWYELPNQPSSFTPEQLKEVRKARLARIICDNTDIIDTTQIYPFVLPDHELNPRVPCRSGIIPSMDFSKWAEPPPFPGNAKQFITDAIVQESNATDLCQDYSISETATEFNSTNETTNPECNMTLENSINSDEGSINSTLIYGNATTETSLNYETTKASTHEKNEISPDTVMKYVNKDNNKTDKTEKTKGHEKNSLRRKRSTEEISESKRAPLIVNYETAHTPGVVRTPYLHYPRKKQSENFIQPSVLADFSLQTLHDRPIVVLDPAEAQNYNDDENRSYAKEEKPVSAQPRESSESSENDSSESSSNTLESEEIRDRRRENYENKPTRVNYDKSTDDKSRKHEDIENRSYGRKTDEQSIENYQSASRKKPNHNSEESNEGSEKEDYKSNEQSSYESSDKRGREEDDRQYDKSKSKKTIGAIADGSNESESQENDKLELRKSHDDKEESSENSNQRNKYQVTKPQYVSDESDEKPEHRNKYYYKENLHDEEKNQDYRREDRLNNDHKSKGESGENPNSKVTDEDTKDRDKSLESDEKSNYRNKDELRNNRDDSRETEEKSEDKTIELTNKPDDSEEKTDNRNKSTPDDSIETLKENNQALRLSENPLSAFSRDVTEREKNNYREKPDGSLHEQSHKRNELEDIEDKPKPFSNLLYSIKNEVDKKNPVKIQDVDLEDFSYERVKLNDKGVVEPVQDNHENYEQGSLEGHEAPTTLKPDDHKERSDYTRKTNEGEIKPVVEISNESSDSSEESEQDRPPNLDSINNDKTIESFDVSKSDESEEKIGKIELTEKKENLKQEFERIPVNYNHDANKKESTHSVPEPAPVNETPKLTNERDQHEDTEYIPAPKAVQYDDQLGIKFDDTPIKLPEIKLPEDILFFNYKEPLPRNDKFYHHGSEDEEENVKRDEDDGDEEDHTDYGPYKSYYQDRTKDDYKKKQEEEEEDEGEDDNVDLYEKFVRERFGKRDSFKKRSEKLQQRSYVPNPKLYETIEKILKKTEETEKEALKSGDPNAGYMWTLEYGEKL